MVDLSSLILSEQEDLVCAFNEGLLLRPETRDAADLFEHLGVFQSEHNYFVFEYRELKDAVQPGGKEAGRVTELVGEGRRNDFVHELRLDHFHLLQRHLRDAVHRADSLEARLESLRQKELLGELDMLVRDFFKLGWIVLLHSRKACKVRSES